MLNGKASLLFAAALAAAAGGSDLVQASAYAPGMKRARTTGRRWSRTSQPKDIQDEKMKAAEEKRARKAAKRLKDAVV